ncbi:MAG: hypothetical protein Ct9H300mP19_08070 [Dehalococcoidia bacterium]|nr:MAG: hypothetical protein Ct9H300mP19_08070 [Dehalococcoidia bacterium]
MTRLIMIRHGETNWNVENRKQGGMINRLMPRVKFRQACCRLRQIKIPN